MELKYLTESQAASLVYVVRAHLNHGIRRNLRKNRPSERPPHLLRIALKERDEFVAIYLSLGGDPTLLHEEVTE